MRYRRAVVLLVLVAAGCGGSDSLSVGSKAPSIKTKTLADVGGNLSRITTYRYPDERMYAYSLDQALLQGKPVLLEFATPAHCTACDNQLQILKVLQNKYAGRVIFLHMDQYQNPEAYKAFRVRGDPWTFIIDGKQVVRFRDAGRMLYGEFDYRIAKVLSTEAG